MRRRFAALLLLVTALLRAEDAVGPGARFDELIVGSTTYKQVVVRSVNARTLVITHAGGMASLRLRDLSPEWRTRFHYDPAAEAQAEATATAAPAPKPIAHPVAKKTVSRLDALLRQFGTPAEVRAEVDLRPIFLQLELGVKDQGHRPSCAVFAVVSALEFQHAELVGHVDRFSEEYLSWAVRRTVQRMPAPGAIEGGETDDADDGFTLSEVVDALRAYGIPLQSAMPNKIGAKIALIEDPPPAVVEEARKQQRVFVHHLPGRDPTTMLNNLVQALNAGVPTPVGMAWPNYRSLRTGYLSGQKPMAGAGHAVTIVGYKCPTGRIEDTVFVFKNSWGPQWGQGGYGTVTYGYLAKYLNDAVVLEVQSG